MNTMTLPIPKTAKLFQAWQNLLYTLKLCRFSALMVAVGWLLMWASQGQDLLIGIAESAFWFTQFWFLVFVIFWAWNAWYFARTMLYFRFRHDEPDPGAESGGIGQPWWSLRFWRDHLPRFLLLLAFAGVVVALWNASGGVGRTVSERCVGLAWETTIIGLIIYLIVLFRRQWIPMVREKLIPAHALLADMFFPLPRSTTPHLDSWRDMTRLTLFIMAILMGGAIILFLVATLNPVLMGKIFNPMILFLIWAGTTTALGSALVYWSNYSGFPILTALIAAAAVFSCWNDNHTLREAESPKPIAGRPTVTAAAEAWMDAQQQTASTGSPIPLVVVATAGGGIRASYWTATVLGRLQDQLPQFDKHLFAISGVSGGSVGAAVYRTVLADLARHTGDSPPPCAAVRSHSTELCAQTVLAQNLLTPVVAGALYPDLVQRFWPLGDRTGLSFPDRQSALEKGFEAGYATVMGTERFAQSLLTLYGDQQQDGSWPALFLNATWVSNGRRIVASNLELVPDAGWNQNLSFITAYDQLSCIGRDLRLSTAAGNSARFPGLSPAGTLRIPQDGHRCWHLPTEQQTDGSGPGAIFGRLVDGGYYENFGATTAQEILIQLTAAAGKKGLKVRPVVIQISSDPGLPANFTDIKEPHPSGFASEILAPITASFATRGAHGVYAARELQELTESLGEGAVIQPSSQGLAVDCKQTRGIFLHFRMVHEPGVVDPPLGWMLSEVAQQRIKSYLGVEDLLMVAKTSRNRELLAWLETVRQGDEYRTNLENLRIIKQVFACGRGTS
jgi:hypothetical protein